MAFTPAEVARIKKYLGYPVVTKAQLLDHGIYPNAGRGTAHLFVVEYNLERVAPEAEDLVREQMERIACAEGQQQASYNMQLVGSAGGVTFNGVAGTLGTNLAYVQETDKLADLLNTPKAPTSLLHQRIGGSGRGAVDEPC